jgi:hypothetical protein
MLRFGFIQASSPVRRAAVASCCLLAASLTAQSDHEFFEKKIRPLLDERCYECHSEAKKVKAGLRLDHPEGWLTGGDSGPALVPGNVDGSRMIRAIRYVDLELEPMPPKSALPADEVALLEEWVRRGAPAPAAAPASSASKRSGLGINEGKKFWSFVPPADVPLPALRRHVSWPASSIDRFVAAEWEKRELEPATDADRATLIRRAFFDLIGLPPTSEQIDAFVRDARPHAFERVVDELLASPHFGERWGRHWLDVARFAESSGGGRTLLFKDAWRYRDYVIDTFNRDVAFDTFIREQLAGDLLPHANPAQRRRQLTATAFLALGPTNYEEQNKGALRMDIVDEQLDTLGKGFLGMTIGCARCHDHKFDPIPTQDYYALAGILRSTRTLENYTDNVAKWVDTALPLDPESEAEVKAHEARLASLDAELKALKRPNAPAAALPETGAVAPSPVRVDSLPGLVIDESKARVVGEWQPSGFGQAYIGDGFLHDRDEGKGAKTVTFTPTLPRSGRYEVRLAYTPHANRASNVPITILHADGEKTLTIDQRQAPPVAERFVSLGQFQFEKDGQGYVLISNEGTKGVVVVDALQLIPVEQLAGSADAVAASSAAGPRELNDVASRVRQIEAERRLLAASRSRRAQTMSVAEAEDIGDTEIRIRGNVRSLGPKVPRGFLQVAMHGPAPEFSGRESGRAQLADWIASPAHPLTARVITNRAWAWLMGAGLVRTVDNFGTTGELPSHPALLDYLARRFVADGWSMKKLVRSIVLSRTYQLATTTSSESRAKDPDNRFLARANRRRLDAEQIRDAILFTSGELKLEIGGPNIGTGPDGAANLPVNAEYGYVFKDTRRSVYTPAFRNQRLELFEVFDFADINAPIGQRNVSTVAPQALYLMNHPFVIEQAKHAATRALASADGSDDARVTAAYRMTLGRPPSARERELALQFFATDVAAGTTNASRLDQWAQFYQALFACVDFRYLN